MEITPLSSNVSEFEFGNTSFDSKHVLNGGVLTVTSDGDQVAEVWLNRTQAGMWFIENGFDEAPSVVQERVRNTLDSFGEPLPEFINRVKEIQEQITQV